MDALAVELLKHVFSRSRCPCLLYQSLVLLGEALALHFSSDILIIIFSYVL